MAVHGFETLAADVKTDAGTSTVADTSTGNRNGACFIAKLTALAGGTTPTVTFNWQTSRNNVNWYTFASSSALSAAGTEVYVTHAVIMKYARISWTVTGGPTTATADLVISADN